MNRLTPLLLLLALTISCSEEEPQLTPNLVTEVKAYDLGNNADASDIRVDFNVSDNLNVEDYRIMVLPSIGSGSFDVGVAASVPETSYVEVTPQIFEEEYSVKRLTSNPLDINNTPVQNEVEYVVAILVEGVSGFQLSEFSNPFTLKDQGIYNGDYEGFYEFEMIEYANGCSPGLICPETGATCPRFFSGEVSTTITLLGDKYSGRFICSTCDDPFRDQGVFSFIIANDAISNILFDQDMPCGTGGGLYFLRL